jgi:hypothetical protein
LPVAIVRRGAWARWRDIRWSYLGTLSGSIAAIGWGLLGVWPMACCFGYLALWHGVCLIKKGKA